MNASNKNLKSDWLSSIHEKDISLYALHLRLCLAFMLLPYAFTSSGSYFEESRKTFGILHFLNEIIVAPQHSMKTVLEANNTVLILPLFG
ncbi:hypothetical protein ACM55M_01725 [Flavobacterium sp. ZT3R25]|uniref:hypothetical protein n=1 Tax=Flavobacterium galactosi TaxID=3398735 RepID=UPI003A8A501D